MESIHATCDLVVQLEGETFQCMRSQGHTTATRNETLRLHFDASAERYWGDDIELEEAVAHELNRQDLQHCGLVKMSSGPGPDADEGWWWEQRLSQRARDDYRDCARRVIAIVKEKS